MVSREDGSYLRYEFDKSDGWSVLFGAVDPTVNRYPPNRTTYLFESDGTINLLDRNGKVVSKVEDTSNLPFKSYEEIMAERPFQTYDETAELFVNHYRNNVAWLRNQRSVKVFTSDYGLYWFDYLSGYDVVLAQLGWNHTTAQDIALVRGAATLQNKDWGAILTWKYTKPPYLASGEELYDQMCAAYEGGAKYVVLFNYAEDMKGPYGTLRNEHFEALERFWNEVVQNPAVAYSGVKAEAAFVLPKNYGGGLRNSQDNIWGYWGPNAEAQQTWMLLQDALNKHGLRLDIVYDDDAYPATGNYSQIYYWNQTG